MSRIRGRDTKPELRVRSALHARGFRFRVNRRGMPGTPDIVLPRWRAVVFVNGCFWHSHGCGLSKLPSSNRTFWEAKLKRTVERDRSARSELVREGWRVLVIWECSMRGLSAPDLDRTFDSVARWIRGEWGSDRGIDELPE